MPEPARLAALAGRARLWANGVGAAFFAAYRQSAGAAAFLPADDAGLDVVMEAFLLRRAVYELGSDLEHRPDWLGISVPGLLDLVQPLNPHEQIRSAVVDVNSRARLELHGCSRRIKLERPCR